MAATKDWSAVTARCATKYFAGGEDASWCVHTPPPRARVVTIRNQGAQPLYVSVPALSGAAAATNDCVRLQENEAQTFVLEAHALPDTNFGTWATDGSTHPMDLTFEVNR